MNHADTNTLLVALGLVTLLVAAVLGRNLSIKVGNIHAELKPNGGSSTKDAVNRIENSLKIIDVRLTSLERKATVAPIAPIAPIAPLAPIPVPLPITADVKVTTT